MPTELNTLTQEELKSDVQYYTTTAPNIFLAQNSIKKLVSRQIKGNDIEQKKLEVLILFDKLFATGDANQNIGIAVGSISKRDYSIHLTAPSELEKIILEKGGNNWFRDAKIDVILQELENKYPIEVVINPIDLIKNVENQLNNGKKETETD
jgi:hypothetical protein